GGPRRADHVHSVAAGQIVEVGPLGARLLAPRSRDRLARDRAAKAAGLVATPGGYRLPRLVHAVAPGDVVHAERGTPRLMQHATGELSLLAPLTHDELRIAPPPQLGSGWITYGSFFSSSPLTSFSARWVVPAAPRAQDGQLLYFFNA